MKKRQTWLLVALLSVLSIPIVVTFQFLISLGGFITDLINIITLSQQTALPASVYITESVFYLVSLGPSVTFLSSILLPFFVSLIIWGLSFKKSKLRIPSYIVIGLTCLFAVGSLLLIEGANVFLEGYVLINNLFITKAVPWYYVFYYLFIIFADIHLCYLGVVPLITLVISLFYWRERETPNY